MKTFVGDVPARVCATLCDVERGQSTGAVSNEKKKEEEKEKEAEEEENLI